MLNENAKQWVAALRSGEYKQTQYRLKDNEGYCCLGVACELAVKAGVCSAPVFRKAPCGRDEWHYGEDYGVLPDEVVAWLGLNMIDGRYRGNDDFTYTLSRINDDGMTFIQIADVIESEPPGLFKDSEGQ